ncbi:HEPN domain protein [Ferroglobus placidus DSM 10642]|uniref:HEPN domain protein n=1 Tax=Ferroglobus placidus (strain DSM 10642 / AEDII12DO) TaxID=589924 RepID=D3S256_FERPA|nr:HEPN domain protein [Ferroglobus placidus DSM 10642]
MNSLSMAKAYIRQAEERKKHAEEAFESGNYPYVIRQCQEAVELSLKAALRIVGIEPPKLHDVGPILRKNKDLFPEWFRENVDKMASISRTLRRERETSMYGDEELSLPPEEIYSKEDAKMALEGCNFVLKNCKKLLEEFIQNTSSQNP